MVRVMMRRRRGRVVRTVRMVVKFVHLASMAVPEALEALEFLPGHRQPFAQNVRAFVDIVLRAVRILGQALVDLRHEQTALPILDELDLDAGDAVNEGRANLDDLKLNLDKLELAVGVLLAWTDLEAKSKALRLGREPMRALVVAVGMVAVVSMLSMIAVVRLAVAIGTVTMMRLAVAVGTVVISVIAVVRLAVAVGTVVLSMIAVVRFAVAIGTVTMMRLAVAIGTVTMGRLAVAVGTVVLSVISVGRLAVAIGTVTMGRLTVAIGAVVLSVIAVGRLAVAVGTVTMGRLAPVGAVVFTMIAMGRLPVLVATMFVMVVLSVVPLHPLVPVDNLRRREDLVQWVARRIQLEAVDEETVMVGLVVHGKGQFEMVQAMDLELEALLRVLAALHQDRAARAFHVDDLALGDLRADALDGVGDLDIGLADLGGQEKCLGRWKGQKARRDREGSQQHGADGDDSRMARYEGVSSITARADGCCCLWLINVNKPGKMKVTGNVSLSQSGGVDGRCQNDGLRIENVVGGW